MKEIEILYASQDDVEAVRGSLSEYHFVGIKQTLDIYYYDPLREQLKPRNGKILECFRVRLKDDKCYMTYKVDKYSGEEWLYSEEEEITIENIETASKIFKSLGVTIPRQSRGLSIV